MVKIRKLLGVGGVSRSENLIAIRWSYFFETIMVLILLWLPLQWYLQRTGKLPLSRISVIDWLIWFAFVSETLTLTWMMKKKRKYLRENWLNLVIIIFAFPLIFSYGSSYIAFFRYLRLLIILRLASVQFQYIYRILRINHFGTTLLAFLIITLLSGMLASYIDPTIGSPWEGIWWAFQTITTVSYGDIVPHTVAGKIFACLLMLLGVSLISIVAANFVAFLLKGNREEKTVSDMKEKLQILSDRLESLENNNRELIEEIKKHL